MRLIETLIAEGDGLGEADGACVARALRQLLQEAEAPREAPEHPRLALWGPLEARLQQRDLVILSGLNEGVWPAPPPQDPFLTRGMRAKLGLPDPEQRLGLAAHDFAQLACAPEVVLTRAQRAGDAPAVASRWIWRLLTLAEGAGASDVLAFAAERDPLLWARALDRPSRRVRIAPPAPRPPVSARPRAYSVTRVETLIRDPYTVYAERVLGLRALDPLDAPFGAGPRGRALHAALERYAKEGGGPWERILDLVAAELQDWGVPPERILSERLRLQPAAQAYARHDRTRRAAGARVALEALAQLEHPAGFTLTARADRIDLGPEGAEILDVKTGSPPTGEQVATGLSPQLTLEAALLEAGAFQELPATRAVRLAYLKFGGRDGHEREVARGAQAQELAAQALANLAALHARYLDPAQPYLSKPRALFVRDWGDFDQLARRGEWADAEAEE